MSKIKDSSYDEAFILECINSIGSLEQLEELNQCKFNKTALKIQLKSNQITSKEYQKSLRDIKIEIDLLKNKIHEIVEEYFELNYEEQNGNFIKGVILSPWSSALTYTAMEDSRNRHLEYINKSTYIQAINIVNILIK